MAMVPQSFIRLLLIATFILSVVGHVVAKQNPVSSLQQATISLDKKLSVKRNRAELHVSLIAHWVDEDVNLDDITVDFQLAPPIGEPLKQTGITFSGGGNITSVQAIFPLEKPQWWTAETPELYTLNVTLRKKHSQLWSETRMISLAEWNTSKNQPSLNNRTLTLKGVHDSPSTEGSSLHQWREELLTLKSLHINTLSVQSSLRYEQALDLLQLTDELGFYVILDTSTFNNKQQRLLNTYTSLIPQWDNIRALTAEFDSIDTTMLGSPSSIPSLRLKQNFSPIRIEQTEVTVKPGRQTLELSLFNHYDFLNLKDLRCEWILYQNGQLFDRNTVLVNLPPKRSMSLAVTLDLPDDFHESEYNLHIQFNNNASKLFSQSIRLKPKNWKKIHVMRLNDLEWDQSWNLKADVWNARLSHRDFSFSIKMATASWFMMTQKRHVRLITDGPYIQTAREPDTLEKGGHSPRLTRLWADEKAIDPQKNRSEIHVKLRRFPDETHPALVEAQVDMFISPFGYIDVRYVLEKKPESSPLTELGLAFLVPKRLNRLDWLGDGPYPSYSETSQLTQWGFHSTDLTESFMAGNRSNVSLVALRDKHGFGLGIMLLDGDVSFIPTDEGTIISVNSSIADGNLNNGARSINQLKLEDLSSVFRLVPLVPNSPPETIQKMFPLKSQ